MSGRILIVTLFLATISSPTASAQDYEPNEVYRSADDLVSVEDLGNGVHLFRLHSDFYISPFLVGDDAVIAVDPINRDAAALYREAVAAVTDKPITKIVYSHDHRDHIDGADVLSANAEIYAHPGTLKTLKRRSDSDIPLPDDLVDNGDTVEIDGGTIGIHYFGPNHGDSNIALSFETGIGKMLVFVDTLEVGIVPYRTLPDTNVQGYIASLKAASTLDMDWVVGGHTGPGPAVWIENYLNYFLDMEAALIRAEAEITEPPSETVEDVISQGEAHIATVISMAVDALRPKYGHWQAFEDWAPLNAEAVRAYIIVGN